VRKRNVGEIGAKGDLRKLLVERIQSGSLNFNKVCLIKRM